MICTWCGGKIDPKKEKVQKEKDLEENIHHFHNRVDTGINCWEQYRNWYTRKNDDERP